MLTGFRPTGPLHVGHWAGNVGNAVRLQDEGYDCFYFVADWHMLTTHYDRTDELPGAVEGLVLDLLAAGIDPARSVVYRQSDLPEVAEMALLLGMITPLGWLERVPTYKERLRDMAERDIANFGLLGYPLLQTVDITIVAGTLVPVGEDQVSHLEISREIVRRFNRLYGDVLLEPQALLSECAADPRLGRAQDVEVARQHDRPRRRPRRDPREGAFVHHRPAEGPPGRPGPSGDLPDLRPAPQVLSRHPGVDGRALPDGRARVRRLQDEPRRSDHRAARAASANDGRSWPRSRAWSRTCWPPEPIACAPSWKRRWPPCGPRCISHERHERGPQRKLRRRAPVFTGPFRLLAELILEQKVDVCDIAVSTVTDGYLAYAKEAEGWNLEEATWFLAICAMLLELKVGRLMPRHTEQDEEDLLGASPDLAYARIASSWPRSARWRSSSPGGWRTRRGSSPATSVPDRSSPTCTRIRWRRSSPRTWRVWPRSCCGRPRRSTCRT